MKKENILTITERRAAAPAVMTKAHKLTRETVNNFPGADYKATFAAALRECWRTAANDTLTASEYLNRISAEEFAGKIERAVNRVAVKQRATVENPACIDKLMKDDADDIRQETAARALEIIADGRDIDKKTGERLSLERIIYRAAGTAFKRAWRAIYQHPTACAEDKTEDGNGNMIVDIYAGPAVKRPAAPEAATMARATAEDVLQVVCDAYRKDALVYIEMSAAGYTVAEIAARLQCSTRRVDRIAAAVKNAAEEYTF